MASFKGEYEHTVDAKGRVSFPAKLRKNVHPLAQDRFTIVKGLERCLYLYPQDRWEEVEQRLAKINPFQKKGRTVIRNFLRSADDLSLDNQNRISLPQSLSAWAGIDGRVVFIGSGERIEIWSPDELTKLDEEMDFDTYQQLFEQVMGNEALE